MEIGTYNGVHACQMIETANIFHPMNRIEYFGFDLFEALTNQDIQKEFTKIPPTYDEVSRKLQETGAIVHLYMGYTKDTLPKFLEENQGDKQIDLVFIDGGHSFETIAYDWNYAKRVMNHKTVVIFDDYYNNEEPEVTGIGCQSLIRHLDTNLYDIQMQEPEDHFKIEWGILRVNMVKVRLKTQHEGSDQ